MFLISQLIAQRVLHFKFEYLILKISKFVNSIEKMHNVAKKFESNLNAKNRKIKIEFFNAITKSDVAKKNDDENENENKNDVDQSINEIEKNNNKNIENKNFVTYDI